MVFRPILRGLVGVCSRNGKNRTFVPICLRCIRSLRTPALNSGEVERPGRCYPAAVLVEPAIACFGRFESLDSLATTSAILEKPLLEIQRLSCRGLAYDFFRFLSRPSVEPETGKWADGDLPCRCHRLVDAVNALAHRRSILAEAQYTFLYISISYSARNPHYVQSPKGRFPLCSPNCSGSQS